MHREMDRDPGVVIHAANHLWSKVVNHSNLTQASTTLEWQDNFQMQLRADEGVVGK